MITTTLVVFSLCAFCFGLGYYFARKYSDGYVKGDRRNEKVWEFFRNAALKVGAMLFALTTALIIYTLSQLQNYL